MAKKYIIRRITAAVLLFVGVVSMLTSAHAVEFPFRHHQEQNIDKHQVGYVDIVIDAEGRGTVTYKWSNGKQWSGNTFYSVVVFLDKKGDIVYSDRQTKGLDGSFGGRAREGSVATPFTLSKEQMAAFDHVAVKMGAENCSLVIEAVKCCDKGLEVELKTQQCKQPERPYYDHTYDRAPK